MNNRVVITPPTDLKNSLGEQGPICGKCSGYGFTYSLQGKKLDCKDCMHTGVTVNVVDLQQQVIKLTRLVNMLYTELKAKGLTNIT